MTNTGDTAISGWTVSWTFANGQTIAQLWNGTFTQSGANVSVKDAGYNGPLSVGASTGFGFTGNWNGANAVPSSITCTPA